MQQSSSDNDDDEDLSLALALSLSEVDVKNFPSTFNDTENEQLTKNIISVKHKNRNKKRKRIEFHDFNYNSESEAQGETQNDDDEQEQLDLALAMSLSLETTKLTCDGTAATDSNNQSRNSNKHEESKFEKTSDNNSIRGTNSSLSELDLKETFQSKFSYDIQKRPFKEIGIANLPNENLKRSMLTQSPIDDISSDHKDFNEVSSESEEEWIESDDDDGNEINSNNQEQESDIEMESNDNIYTSKETRISDLSNKRLFDKRQPKYKTTVPLAVENIHRWNYIRNGTTMKHRRNALPLNPPKMSETQLDALRSARRFLFSILVSNKDVVDKEPEKESELYFDLNKLTKIMRCLNIPATDEEIHSMFQLWAPRVCNHSATVNTALCRECFNENFQKKIVTKESFKNINPSRHSHKKHSVDTSQQASLFQGNGNASCYWKQFCLIFDQCQLKVEKNGKVW